MSRMSVLRSGASLCRAVLGRRRAPKKFFGAFPADGARAASTLAGPISADNVLSSPYGPIEIPTQPLPEYVFDMCESFGNSPAIVSIQIYRFCRQYVDFCTPTFTRYVYLSHIRGSRDIQKKMCVIFLHVSFDKNRFGFVRKIRFINVVHFISKCFQL